MTVSPASKKSGKHVRLFLVLIGQKYQIVQSWIEQGVPEDTNKTNLNTTLKAETAKA